MDEVTTKAKKILRRWIRMLSKIQAREKRDFAANPKKHQKMSFAWGCNYRLTGEHICILRYPKVGEISSRSEKLTQLHSLLNELTGHSNSHSQQDN